MAEGHRTRTLTDAPGSMIDSPPRAVYSTITRDQGAQMADHAAPALATGTKVYFADPHSPRRRPTNENTNGLIREHLPKGTDFNSIRPRPGPGRPGPAQPPPTRSLERTDPHRDTGHHHQRRNHPLTPPISHRIGGYLERFRCAAQWPVGRAAHARANRPDTAFRTPRLMLDGPTDPHAVGPTPSEPGPAPTPPADLTDCPHKCRIKPVLLP